MEWALDVLIVDDSAGNRKILHRVLVQAEVPLDKVHEASDGMSARKNEDGKSRLILSDINMPNMRHRISDQVESGRGVQNVPILMVTTEGSQPGDAGA